MTGPQTKNSKRKLDDSVKDSVDEKLVKYYGIRYFYHSARC